MEKEDFFSKLKNKCPTDEEKERTKKNIHFFEIKNGEEPSSLYKKTDIILLADVFEKKKKVSVKQIDNILLDCVSPSG